jgi:hypothetical protein
MSVFCIFTIALEPCFQCFSIWLPVKLSRVSCRSICQVDCESTKELVGLREHSDVSVDGIGCCVYLSVQRHTFPRVSVKLNFRGIFTCCVMIYLSYVHLKYEALFHVSLLSSPYLNVLCVICDYLTDALRVKRLTS